ncbi:MAG: sce7726 family protein [Flavobacterium nitrogenifigens]|uniref:sce7726 family protein n=1 Tax=Flavobacterium nitrogenifigens TaxID=1617283 RepID=UPI002806D24F|nr:sce7726 family protein [Flavobacterium nitrogenifigens]MDQ8014877.1 sce7726 family protein [Flavobacterium nitrogenifigens]
MTNSNYLVLSKIFSSAFMDKLANETSEELAIYFEELLLKYPIGKRKKVKTVIDLVYSDFEENYRNEHYYKNKLFTDVILQKHDLNNSLSLTEFNVGTSKADLCVFNGTSTVYEIKSEKDSPKRLFQQVEDYKKLFEYVYLVTYPDFVKKIKDQLPDYLGIIVLDNNLFHEERNATSNIKFFEHKYFFDSLRMNEFKSIVNKEFGYVPDVPNTQIYKECWKLFEKIEITDVHNLYISEVRKRELSIEQKKLIKKLPKSIKISTISKRYNVKQCYNIIDSLNMFC